MSKHTKTPPKRKTPRIRNLQPTLPFKPEAGDTLPEILAKMSRTSFQGRNLGRAYQAWADAQKEPTTIMFGLSGAMTAGGMRRLVVHLIEHRMIDGIVSTGANLFHDIYESLGHPHYMGSPAADDMKLFRQRLDRVFDTYADEVEFRKLDWYLGHFMQEVARDRRMGTRHLRIHLQRLPGRRDRGPIVARRILDGTCRAMNQRVQLVGCEFRCGRLGTNGRAGQQALDSVRRF